MKKSDEILFAERILEQDRARVDVYAIMEDIDMPEKRAAYILDKWTKKGAWEWGVNVMFGWVANRLELQKIAEGRQ